MDYWLNSIDTSGIFYHPLLQSNCKIKATSSILMHMNTAIMTLLLKANKDPTYPSSYCPL